MAVQDNTTQQGEFAYFSPGTGRGWKLVQDNVDPRKRVWHLITQDGKVIDTKTGALTIGGNLAEWTRGGIRNVQNLYIKQNAERLAQEERLKALGFTQKIGQGGIIDWVSPDGFVLNPNQINEFLSNNQAETTNIAPVTPIVEETNSQTLGNVSELDLNAIKNYSTPVNYNMPTTPTNTAFNTTSQGIGGDLDFRDGYAQLQKLFTPQGGSTNNTNVAPTPNNTNKDNTNNTNNTNKLSKENLTGSSSGKGMYGLTISEWQKATGDQRRRAKRLSNNNANVPIRGDGGTGVNSTGLNVGGKANKLVIKKKKEDKK